MRTGWVQYVKDRWMFFVYEKGAVLQGSWDGWHILLPTGQWPAPYLQPTQFLEEAMDRVERMYAENPSPPLTVPSQYDVLLGRVAELEAKLEKYRYEEELTGRTIGHFYGTHA